MVSGFLGTLITLERVVALRKTWMYAVPLLTGIGWLATLLLRSSPLGPLLLTLGSLGGVLILAVIVRRDPGLHAWTMLAGMLSWAAGNLLWLSGRPIFEVVYWWQAFLVLTILGERLELNRCPEAGASANLVLRLVRPAPAGWCHSPHHQARLPASTWPARGCCVGALVASQRYRLAEPAPPASPHARHRLAPGPGFVWLSIAGLLDLIYGVQFAGPLDDALLHTVFLGFVISMIFGHAPIIFPAVLGTPINFHPAFYIQLALLHLSLLLRVVST